MFALLGMPEAVPFEGARGHGRSVANTQTCRLARLLLKVLFGQRIELCTVFLLDRTSLAVERLDVVEPSDAVGDPNIRWFEAILPYLRQPNCDEGVPSKGGSRTLSSDPSVGAMSTSAMVPLRFQDARLCGPNHER
jgi:hypothetical protein